VGVFRLGFASEEAFPVARICAAVPNEIPGPPELYVEIRIEAVLERRAPVVGTSMMNVGSIKLQFRDHEEGRYTVDTEMLGLRELGRAIGCLRVEEETEVAEP
jgi:hypothetical protein